MSFFDEAMDAVRSKGKFNFLGGLGSFLGGEGIGKGIEDWTNPVTQLSDRNPILSIIKGEGNLFGSYKPQGGTEDTINKMNTLAALIYGGYMGGAAVGDKFGSVVGKGGMASTTGGETSLSGLGNASIGDWFSGVKDSFSNMGMVDKFKTVKNGFDVLNNLTGGNSLGSLQPPNLQQQGSAGPRTRLTYNPNLV